MIKPSARDQGGFGDFHAFIAAAAEGAVDDDMFSAGAGGEFQPEFPRPGIVPKQRGEALWLASLRQTASAGLAHHF